MLDAPRRQLFADEARGIVLLERKLRMCVDVLAEGLDLRELETYLKRQLPGYMVPNRFERIDKIPLSPSGKADRKALP